MSKEKEKKKYTEENLIKALNAIRDDGMPKNKAATTFGIPRSTLQFRLSEKFKKPGYGPETVLTANEEKELVHWVLECYRKGFPVRKQELQQSVKIFLDNEPRENPFINNLPGRKWYQAFLKRHPQLTERKPEGVALASAVVNEENIRNWFQQTIAYFEEHNLLEVLKDPTRMLNSDETAFNLCPKSKIVLAPVGCRNVYEVENGSAKLNITVLMTFSAAGGVIPPHIVFPYTRLPSAVSKSVPDNWGISVSENGWMKSEIFYDYIKNIFYPYLVQNKVQFPVVLFVDGHSTHKTYHLSELCSKLQIELMCLYPNSTRLLQPADVSVFKPMKTFWSESVLQWRLENPAATLTCDKFAPILLKVVDKISCTPNTIINGFRACGLFPWNPDALDYSKCLGKSSQLHDSVKSTSTRSLTFERFEKIVGTSLIKEFETISERSQKPSYFWTLYSIWKEYKEIREESLPNIKDSNEKDNSDAKEIHVVDLENIDINDLEIVYSVDRKNIYEVEDQIFSLIEGKENETPETQNEVKVVNVDVLLAEETGIDLNNGNISTVSNSKIHSNGDNFFDNFLLEPNEDEGDDAKSVPTIKCDTTLGKKYEFKIEKNNIKSAPTIDCDTSLDDAHKSVIEEDKSNAVNDLIISETKVNISVLKDKINVPVKNNCLDVKKEVDALESNNNIRETAEKYMEKNKIQNFLQYPETPKRKGKKMKGKVFYALSAQSWRDEELRKIQEKEEILKTKEFKRQVRKEQKAIKEEEKNEKKRKRLAAKEDKVKKQKIEQNINKENVNLPRKRGRPCKSNVKAK